MKKGILRCPKCHSSNIYRRVWNKLWNEKSNSTRGHNKGSIGRLKAMSKRYKCKDCKSEFDVPEKI